MNKIIYKISSYNNTYLNKIKNILLGSIVHDIDYKVQNIIMYLKWQLNNSLNTQQSREYKIKSFTLLRSPFVYKTSREQLSINYFTTNIDLFSIFNNKYSFSNYFRSKKPYLKYKQFYFIEKKKNCYFFKNK
jgi:ribosomal protein S10